MSALRFLSRDDLLLSRTCSELDFESFKEPLLEFLEGILSSVADLSTSHSTSEYRREELTKKTKGKKSDGAEGGDDDEEEIEVPPPPVPISDEL